jgi:hypothetical protein
MRLISDLKKNYFICDGNSTTIYELLNIDTENVYIRAVINDNSICVDDRYSILIKRFHEMKRKDLDNLTIRKLLSKKIKVTDLFYKYFES